MPAPRLARTALALAIGAACVPDAIGRAAQAQAPRRPFGSGNCGPVDPTYAFFDNTGGTLDVRAPDGKAVEASERIRDTKLNCGRVLVIDRPEAGVWRAGLSPSGRFSLRVNAESDFDLMTAEFVESGGPLTQGGSFKIAGEPVPGRPATLSVVVFGPAMKSYEFALLSEQGRALKKLTLAQQSEQRWEGSVDVPPEPFRIAVSGVDQAGARYQRSSTAPFHPELVEVRGPGLVATLPAGSESRLSFTIRNAAPDAVSYGIAASDDRGFVTRVQPVVLDLDAGAERPVAIWLKVPADAVAETTDILTVTASSISQRRTSNKTAVALGIRQ